MAVRKVLYDRTYEFLANVALGLINSDRANYGAPPVSLSPIPCGQQHANAMLGFGFFSHWNYLGYKPYMRYTIMGGLGSVSENVAFQTLTPAPRGPYELSVVVDALKELEHDMMYDDLEWDNGHRDNILNPHHNRVSIGVAHGKRRGQVGIFFVEDFEDYYLKLETPFCRDGKVTLSGKKLKPLHLQTVLIYRDGVPTAIKKELLDRSRSYNPGMLAGSVVPQMSDLYFKDVATIRATKWVETSDSIQIEFSLQSLMEKLGPGVYTVYLNGQGDRETYTSLSVLCSKSMRSSVMGEPTALDSLS